MPTSEVEILMEMLKGIKEDMRAFMEANKTEHQSIVEMFKKKNESNDMEFSSIKTQDIIHEDFIRATKAIFKVVSIICTVIFVPLFFMAMAGEIKIVF